MNCATRNRQPAPSSGIGDSASTLIVFEPLTQSPVAARDVNAAINASRQERPAGSTSHNHPACVSLVAASSTCVAAATTRSTLVASRRSPTGKPRHAANARSPDSSGARLCRGIPYGRHCARCRAEEHARLQRRDDLRLVAPAGRRLQPVSPLAGPLARSFHRVRRDRPPRFRCTSYRWLRSVNALPNRNGTLL